MNQQTVSKFGLYVFVLQGDTERDASTNVTDPAPIGWAAVSAFQPPCLLLQWINP